MPYISQQRRDELMKEVEAPASPGELNFFLTKLILEYLPKTPGYADYNSVIGVLECCKLEMYRRAVAPYEDQKIEQNGDVF